MKALFVRIEERRRKDRKQARGRAEQSRPQGRGRGRQEENNSNSNGVSGIANKQKSSNVSKQKAESGFQKSKNN